jgi:hypothetical protein
VSLKDISSKKEKENKRRVDVNIMGIFLKLLHNNERTVKSLSAEINSFVINVVEVDLVIYLYSVRSTNTLYVFFILPGIENINTTDSFS